MGKHPDEQSILAPPFYAVQLDCVFGFRGRYHKTAKTGVKVCALVAVCISTGATAITAKEDLVAVGDVVVFVTDEGNLAGSGWKLGRVSRVASSNSIEIECVVINARSREVNRKTVMRSPRQCSRILGADECRTNTAAVFQSVQ